MTQSVLTPTAMADFLRVKYENNLPLARDYAWMILERVKTTPEIETTDRPQQIANWTEVLNTLV